MAPAPPTPDDTPSSGGRGAVDRRRAVIGASVGLLVLALAAWVLYRHRGDFATAVRTMGFRTLAIALVPALLGVCATFLSWRDVLAGLGLPLPPRAAAGVFFVSQLGKYLPGSVWPVAMQMQLGVRYGARRRTMLAANLTTLVLSCVLGLLVGGVALSLSQPAALGRYWWVGLCLLGLLPLLHPRAIPALLDRCFRLLGREPLGERIAAASLARALVWSLMGWLFFGLHIAALCGAFGPLSARDLAACLGAMALGVSLGVLFIPAPAGAGVRDVALGIVLAPVLPDTGAVLGVVVASRVLLMVADVLLAAVAGVLGRTAAGGRR